MDKRKAKALWMAEYVVARIRQIGSPFCVAVDAARTALAEEESNNAEWTDPCSPEDCVANEIREQKERKEPK